MTDDPTSERDLGELLERLGERTPVGPPPLAAMRDEARRQSKRRWVTAGAAAAAVLAVVGGTAAVVGAGDSGPGGGGDGPDVVASDGFTPPPGTRLVGIGHLAVAVPEEWGTNELRCGTPVEDTVVIGVVFVEQCGFFDVALDVDSLELTTGWWGGFGARGTVPVERSEVADQPAERTTTRCVGSQMGASSVTAPDECRSMLYFPQLDVSVVARSVGLDGRERVEELLSWVHWVDGLVAVPGVEAVNLGVQAMEPEGHAGDAYAAALRDLGLAVETVTVRHSGRKPGLKPGYVVDAQPGPGTMLEPGTTVTMTVAE